MPTVTQTHFASAHRNMRVIRKSAREEYVNGTMVVVEPEIAYQFEHGNLWVEAGQDTLADKHIQGEGFIEQDAAEYLRSHEDHGIRWTEITPVAPDPGPLYAEIADAVISQDADKLAAIGDEEFEEWNRPEVMERVRKGLDLLDPKNKE